MSNIINNFEITNDFTITDGSVQVKTNNATGSLDVSGNIIIGSSTSDNAKLIIKNTNNSIIELKAKNSNNTDTTKSITNKSGVLEFTSNALNKCRYEFNVGDSDSVGFMNSTNKPGIVFGKAGTGSLSVNYYENAHIFYSTVDGGDNALNFTGEKLIFNTSTGNYNTPSPAMIIDAYGNVGMGTASPSVSLDVGGTDAIRIPHGTTAEKPSGQNGYIRYNTDDNQFEGYGNGNWGSLGGVKDIDQDTYITAEENINEDKLRFYTANTEKMIIDTNGRVGIGISSPNQALHVIGSIQATSITTTAEINATTFVGNVIATSMNGTIATASQPNITSVGTLTSLKISGNVGIGQSSPSEKLEVNGNIKITSKIISTDSMILETSANNNIYLHGMSSGCYVTNSGKLVAKSLEVSGDITAFYTSSDKRLKTNIKTIENPLQIIKNIRGVRFNWNEKAMEINNSIDLDKIEMGVIAQEIEEYIPEIIKKGLSDYMAVRYEKIAPLLIEGIKAQQ